MCLYDYFPRTQAEFEKTAEQICRDSDEFVTAMERRDFEQEIKHLFAKDADALFGEA
jgi:hypothetical protein